MKLKTKQRKMAEMLANPEFVGTNKMIYEAVCISHDIFYIIQNGAKQMKFVNGVPTNTEEDNRFVDEFLRSQPKIMLRDKDTGEVIGFVPYVTAGKW